MQYWALSTFIVALLSFLIGFGGDAFSLQPSPAQVLCIIFAFLTLALLAGGQAKRLRAAGQAPRGLRVMRLCRILAEACLILGISGAIVLYIAGSPADAQVRTIMQDSMILFFALSVLFLAMGLLLKPPDWRRLERRDR